MRFLEWVLGFASLTPTRTANKQPLAPTGTPRLAQKKGARTRPPPGKSAGSALFARLSREDGHELLDLGAFAFRALDRVFPVFRNALNDGEFFLARLALVFVRGHGVLLLEWQGMVSRLWLESALGAFPFIGIMPRRIRQGVRRHHLSNIPNPGCSSHLRNGRSWR